MRYEATIVPVRSVVWLLVKNYLIPLNRHFSFILYGRALKFCIQHYFSNHYKVLRHFFDISFVSGNILIFLFLHAYIQRDISVYMNI